VENGKCGKWESEIRAKDIENTTSSLEVNWVWVFYVWEGPFLGWMKTGLPPLHPYVSPSRSISGFLEPAMHTHSRPDEYLNIYI